LLPEVSFSTNAEEDAAAAGIAASMEVVTGHRAVLTTVVEGEGV